MNCTSQILFMSNNRFKSSKAQPNTLQAPYLKNHLDWFCGKGGLKEDFKSLQTIYIPGLQYFHALQAFIHEDCSQLIYTHHTKSGYSQIRFCYTAHMKGYCWSHLSGERILTSQFATSTMVNRTRTISLRPGSNF